MNKKTRAILAVAAGLFSSGAMAQVYLSAGGGPSSVDFRCTVQFPCDDKSSGSKFVAGYGFSSGYAAELGYMDFGEARFTAGFPIQDISARAITLGGAYRTRITSVVGGQLRLGVASMKAKANAQAGFTPASASQTSTTWYGGAGIDFEISNALRFELGVDFSTAEFRGEKADLSLLTLGLRFTF